MAIRLFAVATWATAVLCVSAGQAMAAHVACDDVIAQDTTLDSDLSCPDRGPRVVADGITFDLNGHTISGEGTGLFGVANGANADVTIQNGTIRGFSAGVQLGPVTGNLVRGLTLVNKQFGVALLETDSSRIVRNRIEDDSHGGSYGVYVYGSVGSVDGNVVAGNEIVGVSGAVDLNLGRDNVVKGNSISGHVTGVSVAQAERTVVRQNSFSAPAVADYAAINLYLASDGTVERNRISGGRFGILLDSLVERNAIGSNRIRATEFGILMHVAVSGNLIAENHVLDSSKSGIVLSDDGFEGPSVGNSLVGNHVARSALDGILVQGEGAQGTLVEGNLARVNGDDGIDVEAPGTTITANRANRNLDYGIEAIASVVDGGNNRGRGNGNPAQCLNVVCH